MSTISVGDLIIIPAFFKNLFRYSVSLVWLDLGLLAIAAMKYRININH